MEQNEKEQAEEKEEVGNFIMPDFDEALQIKHVQNLG
jgi:hypothetical protein